MDVNKKIRQNIKYFYDAILPKEELSGVPSDRKIVINNSVFLRDGKAGTVKSELYLGCDYHCKEQFIVKLEGDKKWINSPHKIISPSESKKGFEFISIEQAISSRLEDFGFAALIPIGKIGSVIEIPKNKKSFRRDDTVIGKILKSVHVHLSLYNRSLAELKRQKSKEKEKTQNELLRISYLFVEDFDKLLQIFMGVCDYKPILLWLIFPRLHELHKAFSTVLKDTKGKKVSLQSYQDYIKNARNYRFHSLMPFDKEVDVHLSDLSLTDLNLTLFPSYRDRSKWSGIQFKDRKIFELMGQLTHAKPIQLDDSFFDDNKIVLEKCELWLDEIYKSLCLIAKEAA